MGRPRPHASGDVIGGGSATRLRGKKTEQDPALPVSDGVAVHSPATWAGCTLPVSVEKQPARAPPVNARSRGGACPRLRSRGRSALGRMGRSLRPGALHRCAPGVTFPLCLFFFGTARLRLGSCSLSSPSRGGGLQRGPRAPARPRTPAPRNRRVYTHGSIRVQKHCLHVAVQVV